MPKSDAVVEKRTKRRTRTILLINESSDGCISPMDTTICILVLPVSGPVQQVAGHGIDNDNVADRKSNGAEDDRELIKIDRPIQ